MKEIINTFLFLAAAATCPQSDGFQPVRLPSRPLRQAQKLYSDVPSDALETTVVSQDALALKPKQDVLHKDKDIEQPSSNVQKLLGMAAASAIVGGLVLTHADSAVYQSTVHTLQHAAQAWGSETWQSYQEVLAANPISTKAATSATVYSIGDIIAQKSEGFADDQGLDVVRIARSGLAGGIGHGPLSHFWYNLSEDFFNNILHVTAWWSFLPKIAVDQTVWGPIWNSSYIFLLGLMKQETVEKMIDDAASSTIPLFFDGLKLWPLAHCVTYGLIPVENRLLWVDLVEILWVVILATKASSLTNNNSMENQKEGFES
eukprot:CAMPEP_0113621948 /NCGR_PEP_ID=MMETSP0017_2-20120614/11233_1 /TAXON_ID=2856 /ORGANISM="Cylindrotheca closterium" /LENGTH=316 /DNA_ID=CAMNT_0000531739 /DNA_START=71 /DNA_END=1021 /DNA_ORIENTATION=+ /assembly_acc=CAM_ASM_000147